MHFLNIRTKRKYIKNTTIFVFILLIGLSCSSIALAAKGDPVVNMKMTILSATEDDFVSDKGNFRMNADTLVRGINGNETLLRYVTLPCVAEVEFEKSKGTAHDAKVIVVKKILGKKHNEVMSEDPI